MIFPDPERKHVIGDGTRVSQTINRNVKIERIGQHSRWLWRRLQNLLTIEMRDVGPHRSCRSDRNPKIGDGQGVQKKIAADHTAACDAAGDGVTTGFQKLPRQSANAIDERGTTTTGDVILDLHARPVEVACMEQPVQPMARLFVRHVHQRADLRRPQEAMARDFAHDGDIARCELEGGRRRPLETGAMAPS